MKFVSYGETAHFLHNYRSYYKAAIFLWHHTGMLKCVTALMNLNEIKVNQYIR